MPIDFPEIPGFVIHSQIGRGGFARVYRATQLILDRDVAIKVMDEELATDSEFRNRFIFEGKSMAVVSDHPDIVTIFDIGCVEDNYYIAMQYYPGLSLSDKLEDENQKTNPLEVIKPIASALHFAHSQGLLHRDVKPANILFSDNNRAILADFGIAKSASKNTQLTQAGMAIGTVMYMSPEQLKGLASIDGRSDLYSLGVVLYEMLAGETPYQAADPIALMYKIINEPIPQLSEAQSKYQPIINRLLAKDPNNRYVDGEELIDDINKRFQRELDTGSGGKFMLWGGVAGAIILASAAVVTIKNATPECNAKPDQEALDKIIRLQEFANMAEAIGRIDSPPGANAMDAYSQILELDPCNKNAQLALEKLKNSGV